MESQNNTKQNNIDTEVSTESKYTDISSLKLKFVSLAVIATVVSFCVFFFLDPLLPSGLSNYKKGRLVGYNDAKKVVANSDFGKMFTTPEEVHTLVGSVTSTGNNQLGVHFESMDPFLDKKLSQRTVLISQSTKLYKLVPKDTKTLEAEFKAYFVQSKTKQVNTIALPPKRFMESIIHVQDIKIGDPVEITSSENIKLLPTITATEIKVQSHSSK